jgi:glycosyltransferase involved in cell wall biosynthesis
MKFLFVANTPRDPLAGASGCDISVIESLRSLGHEVDEVWAEDMPRKISHPNLHQLLELPENFARIVASRTSGKQFDVVQVNQPHAWLAAKQHQRHKRPGIFINRSHGWEPALREAVAKYGDPASDARSWHRKASSRLLALFLERHNRLAVHWSDGLVLCSIDDFDYILSRYRPVKEKLLPLAPGIDPFFLDQLPASEDRHRLRRIIYIGNFCAPKAPEVVADVFRRVAAAVPDFEGTWVCPSAFHSQVRQLLGAGAGSRVTCCDWMSKAELRRLMDQHSVLLFPSYFEGFALTFLQAMARGLCVLGTKVDGMRQALRDGQNGYLFDRGDSEGIAVRAIKLLTNPEDLISLSVEARATAESYTWLRTAKSFIEFSQQIITSKFGGQCEDSL